MEKVYENNKDVWVRPWMTEKFDDIYNRDERFFSIVIKGVLSWLTRNIILYNKPIKHFIFNTGSSYLYVESNGYEFSWNETSGEDTMYMQMPRCVVQLGDINIPLEELTQPFVRGTYERKSENEIKGYNAEIRRMPIEMEFTLHYVLANFNESIVLLQEIIDKLLFQKYFKVTYLGQTVECSIEYPQSQHIEINKLDMTSTDTNQKTIDLSIKLCTNYPIINERSEIQNETIMNINTSEIALHQNDTYVESEKLTVN